MSVLFFILFLQILQTNDNEETFTFRRIQSFSSSAVFWIVMYKHVVWDGQEIAVDTHLRRYYHLKCPELTI